MLHWFGPIRGHLTLTQSESFLWCSVLWLPGTAEVRGPLHADGVRLPDAGSCAQAGRPRGPVPVCIRRPAGLAEHRVAGEQSRVAEGRPQQVGIGHLHIRPDLEDDQGERQLRCTTRQRWRPRRGGHVYENRGHAGLFRDLSSSGRKHRCHHVTHPVQVLRVFNTAVCVRTWLTEQTAVVYKFTAVFLSLDIKKRKCRFAL